MTHTRKCLKRIKDHRIRNPVVFFAFFTFREIVLLSKFYVTCAITSPMMIDAASCACRVAWVYEALFDI